MQQTGDIHQPSKQCKDASGGAAPPPQSTPGPTKRPKPPDADHDDDDDDDGQKRRLSQRGRMSPGFATSNTVLVLLAARLYHSRPSRFVLRVLGWQLASGFSRARFTSALRRFMRVVRGQDRAHMMSWLTIRNLVIGFLQRADLPSLIILARNIMSDDEGNVPRPEARRLGEALIHFLFVVLRAVEEVSLTGSLHAMLPALIDAIRRVLTHLNSATNNLQPGHAPTNRAIGSRYDLRVTADGFIRGRTGSMLHMQLMEELMLPPNQRLNFPFVPTGSNVTLYRSIIVEGLILMHEWT